MTIHILSYASDLAGNKAGSAAGPNTLKVSPHLASMQSDLEWLAPIQPIETKRGLAALPEVARMCGQLAYASSELIRSGERY